MATYLYTAGGTSSTTANNSSTSFTVTTTTSAIAYNTGANGATTANLTGCPIIPANSSRHVITGFGNVMAFIHVTNTGVSNVATAFTVTENGLVSSTASGA